MSLLRVNRKRWQNLALRLPCTAKGLASVLAASFHTIYVLMKWYACCDKPEPTRTGRAGVKSRRRAASRQPATVPIHKEEIDFRYPGVTLRWSLWTGVSRSHGI